MKELLEALPKRKLYKVQKTTFVDTCFLVDELIHHRASELKDLSLLSFNADELVHIARHLPHLKHQVRSFLKLQEMQLVEIDVHPGSREKEEAFVQSIEPMLLAIIPDPSDAVLLAAALKTSSCVLTKDKHHLFTATLENYLNKFNIRVFKEMKDYLDWKQVQDKRAE